MLENLRKLCLLFSAGLLIGCANTGPVDIGLNGYPLSSLEWTGNEVERLETAYASGTPQEGSSADSTAQAAHSGQSQAMTGAIIAVVGLIALILLPDDVSACSGSGCANS